MDEMIFSKEKKEAPSVFVAVAAACLHRSIVAVQWH
jgi:hypothetical protein